MRRRIVEANAESGGPCALYERGDDISPVRGEAGGVIVGGLGAPRQEAAGVLGREDDSRAAHRFAGGGPGIRI